VLDLCQCTGYFASVLVLATFAMRNMRLLRITAILSNIAFITYGVLYRLPPIIGLHLLLLLINLVRLIELYREQGARTNVINCLGRQGSSQSCSSVPA